MMHTPEETYGDTREQSFQTLCLKPDEEALAGNIQSMQDSVPRVTEMKITALEHTQSTQKETQSHSDSHLGPRFS